MRQFFSILLVVLTTVGAIGTRTTFAVAPAPTPTAFTGGDASYEAMCALAGMVVAMPAPTPTWPSECHGIYNAPHANQPGCGGKYFEYMILICNPDGSQSVAFMPINGGNNWNSCEKQRMDDLFEQYDEDHAECVMATCVLDPEDPSADFWYKMEIYAPGCGFDGLTAWVKKTPARFLSCLIDDFDLGFTCTPGEIIPLRKFPTPEGGDPCDVMNIVCSPIDTDCD